MSAYYYLCLPTYSHRLENKLFPKLTVSDARHHRVHGMFTLRLPRYHWPALESHACMFGHDFTYF